MKTFFSLVFLGVCSLTFSLNAFAQNNVLKLINIVDEESAAYKSTTDEGAKSYFDLNKEVINDPDFKQGALLEFEGMRNEVATLRLERLNSYMPGNISFSAKNINGSPGQLIATVTDNAIFGLYYDADGNQFHIEYDTSKEQGVITEHGSQAEEHLECGIDGNGMLEMPQLNRESILKKAALNNPEFSPAPMVDSAQEDSITIDLMIVYTQAAEDWAYMENSEGETIRDISSVIAQAMNNSQTALNNSGLGIRLRLVNTTKTDYDETTDGVTSGARLRRITQNPSNPVFTSTDEYDGYMDNIHTIRNQSGADIVALFVRIEDTGGLGWRLGETSGSPDLAFNLNRVQQVAGGYTLIHEIGHNMGNSHSRTQARSPAGEEGGLFHYSVGFQNVNDNYHTVMAYADGLTQAPIFSSPELTWQGAVIGTANLETPENNVLSMMQIKSTISRYRTTIIDSPVLTNLTNQIQVEMNLEDQVTIPVQIENAGNSPLVWSADFRFPTAVSSGPMKVNSRQGEIIEPADRSVITSRPFNYSNQPINGKAKAVQEEVLYSSSFETTESFTTGTYGGYNEWRSTSGSSFIISNSNPNSGSQHLRLQYDGNGTNFVSAPFFGYQLFGTYEITVNFSISSQEETYDIYVLDGNNGAFSAGVIMGQSSQGDFFMFAATPGETGTSFSSTAANVTTDTYHELRILISPFDQEIRYYFNDQLVAANPYTGGYSPGEVQFLHRNNTPGTTYDIDDIEIRKIDSPYRWLTVDRPTGVALEGNTSTLELDFSTVGVFPGTYDTDLVITTNDPNNQTVRIPVTLTVNNAVSNETEDQPEAISLSQNYPNPFNPSTTISYTLNQTSEVLLEVYSIDGRRVATLEQGVKQQGSHEVRFDASNFSSGIYMYRLQTPNQTITKQMVLIK